MSGGRKAERKQATAASAKAADPTNSRWLKLERSWKWWVEGAWFVATAAKRWGSIDGRCTETAGAGEDTSSTMKPELWRDRLRVSISAVSATLRFELFGFSVFHLSTTIFRQTRVGCG